MSKRQGNGGDMMCIKASMILFNMITLVTGAAILGIGLWLFLMSQDDSGTTPQETFTQDVIQQDELPSSTSSSIEFHGISILLLALGSVVIFISFLGVFGAFMNSRALLLGYLSSVTFVLIIQLVVSVFTIIYRQPMTSSIRNDLLKFVRNQYRPSNNITGDFKDHNAWDFVQENFECCGVENFNDLLDFGKLPLSCCRIVPETSTDCGGPNTVIHEQGCLSSIQLWIFEQLHYFGSAVITLVFLQLYGIIAATLLFFHAKSFTSKKPHKPTPESLYKSYSYERAYMD